MSLLQVWWRAVSQSCRGPGWSVLEATVFDVRRLVSKFQESKSVPPGRRG